MRSRKILAVWQIFLLVSLSFYISIIMGEILGNGEGSFVSSISLGKGWGKVEEIVGKLEQMVEEDKMKINTCPENLLGSKCQEYPKGNCGDLCNEDCVDSSREELPAGHECELGTCIDDETGICTPRTPRAACEDPGGRFVAKLIENVEECAYGCCLLKEEGKLLSERMCEYEAESLGVNQVWLGEIQDEAVCFAIAESELDRGACVDPNGESGSKDCVMNSGEDCLNLYGEEAWHKDKLCSNEDLGTVCEKQNYTSCVEGRDEIFWFDSCGNRENIYDADKEKSWNDGEILRKADSCEIGVVGDPLKNQGTCGNCNRFFGSRCGNATAEQGENLFDSSHDVVCRDLGCYQKWANGTVQRRENGESWCMYQTNTGIVPGEIPILNTAAYLAGMPLPAIGQSIDPPGSMHFKQACINGNITQMEPCADHRNAICVETQMPIEETNKKFSTAVCRANRWQECLNYNPRDTKDGVLGKMKVAESMLRCDADVDCFVSSMSIEDNYKFLICLPKYAPGLDLKGEESKNPVCAFGSQKCTSVWVFEDKSHGWGFGAFTEWVCQSNCDCVEGDTPQDAQPSQSFLDQSSRICSSVGDCGGGLNYIGKAGNPPGYRIERCDYEGVPDEDGCSDRERVIMAGPKGQANMNNETIQKVEGKYIDMNATGLLSSLLDKEPSLEDVEATGGVPMGSPDYTPKGDTGYFSLAAGGGVGLGGLAIAGLAQTVGPLTISSMTVVTTSTIGPTMSIATFTGLEVTSGIAAAAGEGALLTDLQLSPFATVAPVLSGALTGASIAIAASSIIIEISGMAPGIGSGGALSHMIVTGVSGAVVGALVGAKVAIAMATAVISAASSTAVQVAMAVALKEAMTAVTEFFGAGLGAVLLWFAIILIVISIANLIIGWAIGTGETRTVEVMFNCEQWQPPSGGEDCEICNEGEFPCNEYSCHSLGQTCEYNQQEPDGICFDASPDDASPPKILGPVENEFYGGVEYSNVREDGFDVRSSEGEQCFTQYEFANIGFETDEYSRCKMSGDPMVSFVNMVEVDGLGLRKNHTLSFSIYTLDQIGLEHPPEEIETEIDIYIACQDGSNNTQELDRYVINTCLKPIDLQVPYLQAGDSQLYSVDDSNGEVEIFVDEKAEVRWSFEDKPFEEMENRMYCPNDQLSLTARGYRCTATVPFEDNPSRQIYVRAKDKPGLEGSEREEDRMANQESTVVGIRRTENGLSINSMNPDGETIVENVQSVSVEIEVGVSGGDPGTTKCYLDNLEVAGVNGVFRRTLVGLGEGYHDVDIFCRDQPGNIVRGELNFTIEQDFSSPRVARVYREGSAMKVITTEQSNCYYHNEKCQFSSGEGEEMSSGDGIEHSLQIEGDKKYYIKCEDVLQNTGSRCNLVVSGGML